MINKYSCINIYENRKKNSKLSSQILYGEKFSIIKKYKDFCKIKTDYDKYVGFIKKRKFEQFAFKPTHKVSSLKANIFSKPIKNSRIKMKLSFTSLLQVKSSNKEFFNFSTEETPDFNFNYLLNGIIWVIQNGNVLELYPYWIQQVKLLVVMLSLILQTL